MTCKVQVYALEVSRSPKNFKEKGERNDRVGFLRRSRQARPGAGTAQPVPALQAAHGRNSLAAKASLKQIPAE